MYKLTTQRAQEIVSSMRGRKVVVLGDVMLDEFVWGDVTRISPEAPVPVVDIQRESFHLGGAANVLANLVALGARASVVGVIGNDAAGERLRSSLRDAGADQDEYLVTDEHRPSTVKTRIIAHSQLVVRADRESRRPVNGQTESRIIEALQAALENAAALIVSDYDKGVVTPRILEKILPLAYDRVPVLIDPKLRNFGAYRPATLVTPNHHEALRMASLEADTDEGLHEAARRIRAELNCDAVLITRGDRGMMLLEGTGAPVYVATAAREVYDVTGAGDTVIATLAAALAGGSSLIEAATLANHAAGIVVGKVGTATASADELVNSFN
ncbi:MAG TPA: D-glycero-beta-D-manno-heptose-7-phosphate kinase [Pyrinomonadaceae bacterium]|nr:D-glycero-beta-D-manno-heptose-7-phosphate kinase [Pyrinomonadaceae bacterium]